MEIVRDVLEVGSLTIYYSLLKVDGEPMVIGDCDIVDEVDAGVDAIVCL